MAPLSRRSFLAHSAILGSTLSGGLFAGVPRAPRGEAFRVAVIGCGIRARNLLRGHFLPESRFRVVEVCEVVPERLAAFKSQVDEAYGDTSCRATADWREVIGRSDVDGVLITTPDHWHALQAIHALRAGKHVYCEKPLTRTLEEAELVARAAAESGLVFQTGSQQRTEYGQRFIEAVERIRAGHIGTVLSVHVGVGDPNRTCDLVGDACELEIARAFDRWLGPAPARPFSEVLMPLGNHNHYPQWRRYAEYAGGGLADMGAHHFDIAQWALGMDASGPVRVEPPPAGAPAGRGASVVYANGVRMVHGGPSGATFVGTEGTLYIDRGKRGFAPANIEEKPLPEEGSPERLPRPKNHAHDWLDAIETGGTPACSAEVGARTAAVCHLLNLAYRHGRALDWDPAAWRFVDDEEANGWRSEPAREGYELPS